MREILLYVLAATGSLAIIGYLRSVLGNKANELVINLGEKTRLWMADNSLLARFSILFMPLLVVYNVFAWAVFGIISIAEFLAFLLGKIWWLILWVWFEVLHPTLFTIVKLLWHYIIVFAWKFFEFSFSPIKESVKKDTLIFTIKKLLILTLIFSGFFIANKLIVSIILLVVSAVLFFFIFQYIFFQTVAFLRSPEFSEDNIKPSIRTTLTWFGISVLSAAILLGVYYLSKYYIAAGIGVSIAQAATAALVLLGVAFVSSTTYLPAHISKHGQDFKVLEYLKSLLFRLPKLIYAQPFQIVGLVILAIVPFVVAVVLNAGVENTTGKSLPGWAAEVNQMNTIIPEIKENRLNIEANKIGILELTDKKDSIENDYNKKIAAIKANLEQCKKLYYDIKDNEIHTFIGNPIVGEEQFFSVPSLPSCGIYKWVIKDVKTNGIITSIIQNVREDELSIVIRHTWNQEGEYLVSLVPQNTCGGGNEITTSITVVKPEKGDYFISGPFGKVVVCTNEEAEYTAEAGFESYQWTLPGDAAIVSAASNKNQVKIKFGTQSGTVRVRAQNKEGKNSLWKGINVRVLQLPGSHETVPSYVTDETLQPRSFYREFAFETREAASDSIKKIEFALASTEEMKRNDIAQIDSEISLLTEKNIDLKKQNKQLVYRLIGDIFALVGLSIFISIILSSLFAYFILFHFGLYGFEQNEAHYWERTLSEMRAKNPKQPLLGIFVLVSASGLFYLFLLKPILSLLQALIMK